MRREAVPEREAVPQTECEGELCNDADEDDDPIILRELSGLREPECEMVDVGVFETVINPDTVSVATTEPFGEGDTDDVALARALLVCDDVGTDETVLLCDGDELLMERDGVMEVDGDGDLGAEPLPHCVGVRETRADAVVEGSPDTELVGEIESAAVAELLNAELVEKDGFAVPLTEPEVVAECDCVADAVKEANTLADSVAETVAQIDNAALAVRNVAVAASEMDTLGVRLNEPLAVPDDCALAVVEPVPECVSDGALDREFETIPDGDLE